MCELTRRQLLSHVAGGTAAAALGRFTLPDESRTVTNALSPVYTGRRDFTYLWWADGLINKNKYVNIQTGYYGMSFDADTGKMRRLGCISAEYTRDQVLHQDNTIIESLPQIDMDYTLTVNDKLYTVDGVVPEESDIAFRIIDSGTYMQRGDMMHLRYRNIDLPARVEFSAVSRYLTYNYQVLSKEPLHNITLCTAMRLDPKCGSVARYLQGRVLTVSTDDGGGYIFIIPEASGAAITYAQGEVRISHSGINLQADQWAGMSWTCIPADTVSEDLIKDYLAVEQVEIAAQHLEPTPGKAQVAFDRLTGVYRISTPNSTRFRNFAIERNRTAYERIRFSVANPCDTDVTVPVCFYKAEGDRGYNISGMSPMLRDAVTLEPIGQTVQISKNWHTQRFLYHGPWFHSYTYIKVPAAKKVEYEFTMAYANWGKVFAASHSQLSLAGWKGGNQLWHTSGIGSFGESFCYDPDIGLQRAMIDDVRLLCVKNMYGTDVLYTWTNDVGGGDFLVYYDDHKARQRLVRMKVDYIAYGPNLTHVAFAGMSNDGAVEARIDTHLPRTDDIARAYHRFRYVFKKDVRYSRLAFYQFGADNYNDNKWEKCAWGDVSGLVKELDVPLGDHKVGYMPDLAQSMTVPGDVFWVGIHRPHNCMRVDGHYKDERGAPGNKALAVRQYSALINGKMCDKPSFSVYRTNNFNLPCVLIEISPPREADGIIRSGSVVEAIVEFMVLPQHKTDYYGPSTVLSAVNEDEFDTWKLAHRYASTGQVKVEVYGCELLNRYPVRIQSISVSGGVAAQFEITGGMGYVPLVVSGLDDYRNWRLFLVARNGEVMVDQSVKGNDYWQCHYDPYTGKYSLGFNVEHNGDTKRYVLRRLRMESNSETAATPVLPASAMALSPISPTRRHPTGQQL